MCGFSFATCDRRRALQFLQDVYPGREITDTPDCAGPLLDLVEADIARVQDPMMHGSRIQVIAGYKSDGSAEERERIIAACKVFA